MSTTQTTNLGLTKATPGTGEPFSTSVVNTNLDTIDSAVGELQDSVSLGAGMKRVYFFHEDTNIGIRMTTSDDAQVDLHIDTVRNRLALYKDGTWYVFTPDP